MSGTPHTRRPAPPKHTRSTARIVLRTVVICVVVLAVGYGVGLLLGQALM